MKKTKEIRFAFALSLFLIIFAIFPIVSFGSDGLHEPLESPAKGYEIEDISAEILSDGEIVLVSGKVRSLSHKPIKGGVVIYMVDGANGIIHLVETEVNKKRPIQYGGIGLFEIYENVEGFELDSIANIFIDFVEN